MTKKKTTKKVKTVVSPSSDPSRASGTTLEERTAADALGEELANEAPGAAMIAMLAEFKKLTVKVDKLETENNQMRDALVMEKDAGGRYLVRGEHAMELPVQEEPIDYEAFAVFRSPSGGFKQKLVKSHKTRFDNGDFEIAAPVFGEFEEGVCVLTDEELIGLMRKKEKENLATGRPMFVEVSDKEQKLAAHQGKLKARKIKSQSVTVDTPLAELAV